MLQKELNLIRAENNLGLNEDVLNHEKESSFDELVNENENPFFPNTKEHKIDKYEERSDFLTGHVWVLFLNNLAMS